MKYETSYFYRSHLNYFLHARMHFFPVELEIINKLVVNVAEYMSAVIYKSSAQSVHLGPDDPP